MVLLSSLDRGVLTLTLNRPEKLNALNWDVLRALDTALSGVGSDADVRCVVVAGTGDRAFSAGADLNVDLVGAPDRAKEWIRLGHRVFDRLATIPQPVVAALRGYVLGGGLEMAMACDFRIAAEDVRLGLPEVSRGWTPGWGGLRRLGAIVGPARARELAFLGGPVDAATALQWGLVTRVVPATELAHETSELAARLADLSPHAVGRAKAALVVPGLVIADELVEEDAATLASFVSTPGYRAAVEAFLNRRRAGVGR